MYRAVVVAVLRDEPSTIVGNFIYQLFSSRFRTCVREYYTSINFCSSQVLSCC